MVKTSHILEMLHHPAWAVGRYSSSPTVGTKSTGGFYQRDGSPCTPVRSYQDRFTRSKMCEPVTWFYFVIQDCKSFFGNHISNLMLCYCSPIKVRDVNSIDFDDSSYITSWRSERDRSNYLRCPSKSAFVTSAISLPRR